MQLEFLKFTIKSINSRSEKLHIHIYVAISVYLHVSKKQVEAFYSCSFRVKNDSNRTESDY